jgi:putative hydrolase of the HAD superfamily
MAMTSSCSAVLFDLGNTLAAYYRAAQFDPILARCVEGALAELQSHGVPAPTFEAALTAARAENREAADFRFAPLEQRLARIFALQGSTEALVQQLCRRFLEPIFALGRVYEDALPVLRALRERGYATGIVSNAPWGSSPDLWRVELERLGLARAVNDVVFCGDVGWRKPARQIFLHAAERLRVRCEDCLFVGDDLQWDVAGSAAVGMRPVLVDRHDAHRDYEGARIGTLLELETLLVR